MECLKSLNGQFRNRALNLLTWSTGYLNSTDEFIDQPKVVNGASDLITNLFESNGAHARAAISTNSLPLGVAVEVDAIFELK